MLCFTTVWGAISELIARKFGILIDLAYVIDFFKFGYDR